MKELNLKEYLRKYKNTRVDFYRFPGNYGDSLIWHGTKDLMCELDIRAKYVDVSLPLYSDILFIDGGGNFNDYYSDVRNFLIKKGDLYRKIVILPHTIFGKRQIDILNSLNSSVVVFCREKHSFDFVEKNLKKGEVYLWHDCAFYNNLSSNRIGFGISKIFRIDGESTFQIKGSNNDLSSVGYARSPLSKLINTLDKYETIHTDRLHIAIASTLLNKKVRLYSNSYYKNEAVYNYSLIKYTNIEFIKSEQSCTHNPCSSLILDIFTKFNKDRHNQTRKRFLDKISFEDMVYLLISANKRLWELEDATRVDELNSSYIAKAKKLIDKTNQTRNDIIKKIDKNLSGLLCVEPSPMSALYSESPGMIIDRLSILFIKFVEIQKISKIIKEKNLEEEYLIKEKLISRQMEALAGFLDVYFIKLKSKKVYFLIQDAVKIYNDKRIKKYIAKVDL